MFNINYIVSQIKYFFEYIVDIIFPPKCIICKREAVINNDLKICPNCLRILKECRVNKEIKDEDGKIKGIGILRYDGLVRFLIHRFKYKKEKKIANILAEAIYDDVKDFCNKHHANCFVPIPLHKRKFFERGFNQSDLVIRIIAKRLNKQVRNDLIEKKIDTVPQSTLKTNEKRDNIKDSFGVLNKEEIKGKDIILFDDIYTTGSTIEECSKLLYEHNTRKVYFLSISISNKNN